MKKTLFLLTLLTLTQTSFTADAGNPANQASQDNNLTIKCGPLDEIPNIYTFKIRPNNVKADIEAAVRTFRIEGTPNDYGVYMEMRERTATCAFAKATVAFITAFVNGE